MAAASRSSRPRPGWRRAPSGSRAPRRTARRSGPASRARPRRAPSSTHCDMAVLEPVNTDTTSGHGTHVAGTIAARGTASSGRYVGIAPGAHLIGIGAGEAISILWALEGYDYAIANRDRYQIKVIRAAPADDVEHLQLGASVHVLPLTPEAYL